MTRLLPLVLLAACAPPDASGLFTSAVARVLDDGASTDAALVDAIDGTKERLHVALPYADDTTVSDAILRAFDRGVDVQVLTDVDREADPGIAALLEAGVPVSLADGGMTYFDFTTNADVTWTSDQVRMTDCWVVTDGTRVLGCTLAGSAQNGPRVLFDARGEEIAEDVLSEHNQIFGGTDATALTSFSNPAKSILDLNFSYPNTDDTRIGVFFGPQERLTKRVIDAVYGARSSVRILTDDLSNDGLARALQDKAENGFDITVITGPHLGDASSVQGRFYENDTPDVEKFTRSDVDQLPTVILVDFEETRLGQRSLAKAMVLTHDLVSSARIWKGTEVVSDQVLDGTLWTLEDSDEPSPEMIDLLALFDAQLALAEEL